MTKYIKEEDLHKVFPANSKVTFFPNPRIIEVNGTRCEIIRKGDAMAVYPLTQAEADWYVRKKGNYVRVMSSTGVLSYRPRCRH